MKLKHHTEIEDLRDFQDVTVREGLTIRVYALTWDFEDEFNRSIPTPEPNKNALAGSADDEEHKATVDLHGLRRMAALLHVCLDPEEVEWETKRSDHPGAEEFYDALSAEIRGFMTPRQALLLGGKAAEMASVTADDVEKARDDFLTEAEIEPMPPEVAPRIEAEETLHFQNSD